ncbi:tyrosine-type recombinase/integrase [Pseudofulvibacter geojedonensis]|uniref:Tyrosine recombinase XerC n=1 Tax=Pseudofulvibacter geojedonensis TaxID=1123758 RepID=A0ABW3I0Q0_9FLAO
MPHIEEYSNYLSLEKKYSKHTVLAYVKDVEEFIVFCETENLSSDIDKIAYVVVRSWLVKMSEHGLSNRSINRKIASLKSYYKFLLKIRVIEVSPLLKHKALKNPKKVQVPFSVKEMNDVFELVGYKDDFEGKRDRLIIELFYSTGIRKAELIALKFSDIFLDERVIKVLGKRNKERLIPITQSLVDVFSEYLSCRKNVIFPESNDFVFVTKKGSKIYDTLVYRIINSYFSIVSSKLKKSPHVLRHTFATHLLNEGADLNAVKELLGHTSLAATQVYTHNSMAKLKDVYRNTHPRNRQD